MEPEITMQKVVSSQIEAIGQDPATKTLAIRFNGKGGAPGVEYRYANFTAREFDEFKNAPSVGSHFYRHIKPFPEKYPYRRIG